MADPLKTSDIQAPEEDIFGWNFLVVDGRQCPGQCLPIDFEREREIDQPKKKGASVNVLYDQGLKPGEVPIRIRTTTGDALRDLQDFYNKYMDPERPLAKRTVVTVAHPQLYARGVKAAYFFKASSPMPTREGGVWPLISTFHFAIVDPKTQISAASGSSKPKLPTGLTAGPTDRNFIVSSVRTAVDVVSAFNDQPVVQVLELLTPSQINKSANAGDNGLAQFVQSVVDKAAP
jgi:hypothetical protein